jgi:TonB family protein
MAPILKEVESPAANTAVSSPTPPQAKPASEAPARPQPVALEIPVTINGARTVDGSDKRVPFSESTQTVLVFPHGAVIRIATPLTSGQLVFLTNEKTKKEVVCQVVKSKSSGGAGAYVELQFTEPSLAFWGLQIPGPSPAPSAPRPVAPISKPPVPSAPISAKPPVASKPVASAPVPVLEVKSVPPPPLVAVTPPAPVNVVPAAPKVPAPSVVPPPEAAKPAPSAEIPSKIASAQEPPAPPSHGPASPLPPLRDYSKQIDALFAVPQAPTSPAAPPAPVTPSTDDLKLQAARLQEQLGSLLFTEKTPAPPAAPSSTAIVTPEMMANDLSAKLADLIQGGPSAADSKVPKGPAPVSKPTTTSLGAEEEVKIPSWLGSVENAEVVVESKPSGTAVDHTVSATSEESLDSLVADESSQSPAFGGQILGDSAASAAAEATPTASKTALFAALAAAALLIVGGGAWYYHQSHSDVSTAVATTHASGNQPASVAPSASNPSQSSPVTSSSTPSSLNSSTASSSRPSINPAPIAVPPAANSVSQPKNLKPAPKEEDEPQVEAHTKSSSLGKVHLAAPVVNHSDADSQADSDAFASIDTKSAPASGDPLAAAESRHNSPAAPLPVGGVVKQAQLLKSVAPEYPTIAKVQHVSGRVQIEAVVDTAGNVAAVKALSGPALLHQAALDAVKKWKYSPAVLDGQPTITHVIVNVDFRNQ